MKDYSSDNPVFSESIDILETTDTNHADNFNVATMKLYENTMVLKEANEQVAEQLEELEQTVGQFEGFSYNNETETLVVPATVGSLVGETLVLSF